MQPKADIAHQREITSSPLLLPFDMSGATVHPESTFKSSSSYFDDDDQSQQAVLEDFYGEVRRLLRPSSAALALLVGFAIQLVIALACLGLGQPGCCFAFAFAMMFATFGVPAAYPCARNSPALLLLLPLHHVPRRIVCSRSPPTCEDSFLRILTRGAFAKFRNRRHANTVP